jgi:hypothetical protein
MRKNRQEEYRMVLKTLTFRKSSTENVDIEEWNYFDNIQSATTTYDEKIKMSVVGCSFKDGNTVTIAVENVAYLMSDSGKTIDKIYHHEERVAEDNIYETLTEAVNQARDAY